jgi:hypothetical protein
MRLREQFSYHLQFLYDDACVKENTSDVTTKSKPQCCNGIVEVMHYCDKMCQSLWRLCNEMQSLFIIPCSVRNRCLSYEYKENVSSNLNIPCTNAVTCGNYLISHSVCGNTLPDPRRFGAYSARSTTRSHSMTR